jgi:hypothetical protein
MNKHYAFKLLLALSTLYLTMNSCNPDNKFKKAKKINTIEAYNSFIEKHPSYPLIDEAVNLRDQLALDIVLNMDNKDTASQESINPLLQEIANADQQNYYTITADSIKLIKINALNNLIANAELNDSLAKIASDFNKSVRYFAVSGEYYILSASILKTIGKPENQMYKKAAFAYYQSARKSQAAELNSMIEAANNWTKGREGYNVAALEIVMLSSMAPHHLQKTALYKKSAELFRRAGLYKQSNWMMNSGLAP